MKPRMDWRNLAVVATCALPLLGFWATGLTDLDEGFYGAVVANMARTGDWVTPHFNGHPWFEKPILTYWLATPSVMLFGEDFGPRLPSVLCTLLTSLVLFRFLKRRLNEDVARVATAAYGGSLLVVGTGRLLLADAPFVLALTIALSTFYDSLNGDPKRWLLTALALGFAVLAKGPVACVLFALIAGTTYWRMPELRPNFKGYWLTGFALFAAVVSAWYVPCYLANGQAFVHDFLYQQNIGRFVGGDDAHRTAVWAIPLYFPLVLFLTLVPWSVWAPRSSLFRRPTEPLLRFLWIWGLVVVGFFSVSLTKLPHYVLPAVAPFIVLTVVAVMEKHKQGLVSGFWLKCALAWSLVVAAFATPVMVLDHQARFSEVQQIAKYLRDKDGTPMLFGSGRSDKDSGISTTLKETSHPSFLFYTSGKGLMTDDVADLANIEGTVYLVAKPDRLDSETRNLIALSGFSVQKQIPPFATRKFGLWRLTPLTLNPAP